MPCIPESLQLHTELQHLVLPGHNSESQALTRELAAWKPRGSPRIEHSLEIQHIFRGQVFFFLLFFSFFLLSLSFFLSFLLACSLRSHLWHMEFPRLGVKLELQLPAYTTAIATWDPSHICDLHNNPWQCGILTAWNKARD